MIRVVAGRFRGRHLKAPPGLDTRPTSARVRKALFDILGGDLDGSRVADCFAGTGALGIEALSRGAGRVDFYENARPALTALQANVALLKIESEVQVFSGPLPDCLRSGAPYDLILLDPPWRRGLELAVVSRLGALGRIGPDTRVVIERDSRDAGVETAICAVGLDVDDQRQYGDTTLCIFRPRAAANPEVSTP